MSTRDEQIQYIREAVINNSGPIALEDSILLHSIGKDHNILIEDVFFGKVSVTEYVYESDVDSYFIDFHDLSDDIIAEIALGVENYEADLEKDMKRIR